ncbi:hypothetical protein [Undibacter mobilis]|uniref:Dolichyl-phosphate-mannose-protein mannosyltransferase n=1 Tax=Undibacter mobilis TaxID=2292256 RepID=A0A371BC66_9BRAD|nr:hypothetical protein [Undibacter mobilis]RDV05158.1 hypothetical protein DXH78_11635 [Undibacter mobilis]
MADIQIARHEPLIARHPFAATSAIAWIVAAAGMIAAMLAPALWNGFPIIFPDTGGYFTAPMVQQLANGRSALYGLFLNAGIPLAFWPCVVAQAALMAWLVVVTLRVNGLGGRPYLALGIVVLLCIGTSLPWFAGQLMPDILFAAAALALYLLAYADTALARWERWLLGAVVAFAMASHMAAAGLFIAVIAAIAAMALTHLRLLALPRARLTFAAAAVGAGILLCPVSNLLITGNFAFTPGGTSFLFGRFVEDGIVNRYLNDHCPDPSIRLCTYKDEIVEDADSWLWWGGSPLYKMGGWDAYEPEAKRIIRETLAEYPAMHLATAIEAAAAQFFSFQTEVGIDDNGPTRWAFEEFLPKLYPTLLAARQQAEPFDVEPLNQLHLPVAYIALAAMALAMIFRRRLGVSDRAYALCLVLFAALAANAVICGVFSHPVDRYQSRLVLLAPFVVAVMLARRFTHVSQKS